MILQGATSRIAKYLSFLLILTFLTSGCSWLKASAAPDSGFLSRPEHLAKDERFPFHGWWVKSGEEKSSSGSFYISPVNISHLNVGTDWSSLRGLTEEEIREEAQKLGDYFRQRLEEAFAESEHTDFKVVKDKEHSDGILEIAIVELVPTNVIRNAAGLVVGRFVPGGGAISLGTSGSIAIEGRFINTRTGEIVAQFKDREKGKFAPVDFTGLTRFQIAKNCIDDWASQIVELIISPPRSSVSDSSPFTLMPW